MSFTEIKKVNINDISRNEFGAAYSLMSDDRKKKCDALKREDDKRLCIAADMLLRKMISESTSIPVSQLQFCVSRSGKPYLEGEGINFSISHSGEIAAVAVNKLHPVGIDVEKIAPVNPRIARRIFSEDEISFVFEGAAPSCPTVDDPLVLERFFRVWTYKEAYVKMTGEGITDNIRNVHYDAENCLCEIFDGYCLTVITKE